MKDASESRPSWFTSAAVLYRWIPAAFAVFLCAYLWSALIYFQDRPFRFAQALMSVLAARTDNPNGYGYAAFGTGLCGALLLPVVALLRERLSARHPHWSRLGVGLILMGLLAVIAIGLMAPVEYETYSQLHVYTAFLVFMSLTAGLAVCLTLAARLPGPLRWCLAGLAVVEGLSLGFLVYIYFVPYPYDGYGPGTSLAALEWTLTAAIALSMTALAAALQKHGE